MTRQQALLVGHRQQRLPNAPSSVPDHRIAFSKYGQRGDRQPLESRSRSARSLRRLSPRADRRAACLTDW